MSRYRKVDPRIWKDEKVRRLDQTDKLLVHYAITGQSNRIGVFTFSPGMAAEDVGLDLGTFRERFRNVCRKLSWTWDEEAGVLYLPTWWKYNPPENANVLVGNLKDLGDLPHSPALTLFCENLQHLAPNLHETFRITLPRTLSPAVGDSGAVAGTGTGTGTTPSAAGAASVSVDPIEAEILNGNGHRPVTGKSKKLKRREDDPPGFLEFWTRYPKDEDRTEAVKEWRKLDPDPDTVAAIMAGLDRWLGSQRFADGYIVAAHRWLKRRRWEATPIPATGLSPKTSGNLDAARIAAARTMGVPS